MPIIEYGPTASDGVTYLRVHYRGTYADIDLHHRSVSFAPDAPPGEDRTTFIKRHLDELAAALVDPKVEFTDRSPPSPPTAPASGGTT